ncbi:hypothetical protein MKW94_002252 [Papaver nudicaule]|uniref:SWIM-type domain-containing protein n=1 Tax=Papaver nudicaule TaxID=74823 RepID=A0AA41UZR5_PAPNU|nr:hypothetical protein [Papaver nudicaule]
MLPGNELVIRKLLSTSWECVGAVGGRRNTVLYLAGQKSYINFKILLESHIVKDELLDNNNVNYWKGGKFVSETADRYIKIVKELLSQSDCKVCFVKYDKDDQNWNGCLAAVIKGKFTDNIFGDVQDVRATAEDGPLIHLSYRRKSITLKVLLRHPRIREIMAIDTPQCLLDSRNTNLMGKLSARMYKRYDQAILLMDAIQMGDVEDYNELLALYPDILDFVSLFPLGGTPLHIAIKAGQGKLTELIKDIIRRRPDFAHYPNRNGFPPLHIASARGYLDIVKELLAQVGHHLCYLNRYASSPSLDDDFDDNQEHVERKKENFDKFLDWDIEYNDEEESLDRNSWARTPLHYAIANERVSVINELLPIWDTSLLRSVSIPEEEEEEEEEEDSEALKMLMSRYIEDELLNSEDYWNTDAASELGSVYIQIMKHLLNPDISCHLSFFFVYKTEEEGRPTDARYNHCSSVIKVKCGIINGENDNLYKMLTTSYLKYFQEVTSTQGKSVLNLWADKEASIITMKIWMRSPLFYIEDFDRMWFSDAEVRHKHKLKDEVQSRVTICNDGIEKLPENGEVEGVQNISEKGFCAESLSEILGDQAQLLEAEEDDNREVHEQELPDVYNTKLSLFTGQTFESARKCRQAIKNASIDDKREIKFLTSGSSKIKALCSDESCQWSLYAKIEKGGKSFIVGEIEGTHTCSRLGTSDKIKLATPQWISDCIVDHIWPDKNAFLKLNDMRVVSFIKREYQIDIEATPASKGKKKAIETIHDLQLQDYTARILQSNPDSKIAFLATKKDKLGKDKEFQGVVISYKACWNGFLNGCAPLVFFEKIPMEKEGNNLLLAAIGVDGNNCMFPFAFALVGKKTVLKDDWEFFFEQLDFILKHPGYKQMAIISNLSYEITKIIENKFPGAEQGPCAWHLALEMQSKFGSDIELYFRPISMAETREEYNEAFEDLKSRNEEAAEWLTENLPRNWVTSKFLPARILPVLATLEQISICSTRMFDERRATATTNSSSSLTDYADKLIKVSDEASKAHNVLPSKQSIYEVQDSNNNRKYEIDLLSKSCTCLCWQKMGIPCSHAIATLKKVQKDTPYSEYCEARYRIQCFGKAYEDTIKPVEVLHTPYEDIRPKKRRKSSDISEGNVGQ